MPSPSEEEDTVELNRRIGVEVLGALVETDDVAFVQRRVRPAVGERLQGARMPL